MCCSNALYVLTNDSCCAQNSILVIDIIVLLFLKHCFVIVWRCWSEERGPGFSLCKAEFLKRKKSYSKTVDMLIMIRPLLALLLV